MEWMAYFVAMLFAAVGALCVASIIFSIPGGWIMLGVALLIEWLDQLYLPAGNQQTFNWWLLGMCAGLLGLGELLEFVAGAAGAKGGGGSKRGMVGALIGGILGAIFFTVFIPIPVVGSLIGAVIGTFIGAVAGETSGERAKTVRGSIRPALGATIGRVFGTMGKLLITIIVWATLSVAAFV